MSTAIIEKDVSSVGFAEKGGGTGRVDRRGHA